MSDQHILSWSKQSLLNWSDFKAESNPAVFEDAHSVIKYQYTWTVDSENFGDGIKFSIKNIRLSTGFYRHLSWVRLPMATPELLNHEQGHFDLAELLRIHITEKIQSMVENKWYPTRGQNDEQRKQFAREDSGILVAKEITKWEKYILEKQQEYDEQTEYGQIAEKQLEYDLKFRQLHT